MAMLNVRRSSLKYQLMKTLKKIGISLLVLIVLLLIAMFLVPKSFNVSVTEKIDAKPNTLYNIVTDLTLENQWSPWQSQDTSMVVTYGDISKGQGASSSWTSENMGDGTSVLSAVVKNKSIVNDLSFGKTGGGVANFTFDEVNGGTNLTWSLDSETNRPINLINFLIRGDVKKNYRVGLQNLAKLAKEREQQGMYSGFQIKEELIPGRTYVTQREVVKMEDVETFFAKSLGPIFQKLQKANVTMEGHPSGLVYKHDMATNELDMAAGIPISQDVNISGSTSETIETQQAVVVDYYGDPAGSTAAHMAIDQYLTDRDLIHSYPVVEEYVTDPSQEPDPSKWLTRIIYFTSN